VGRADHARPAGARLVLADPLVRAVLQHPQQLDLERQRQVAHFVQEQRASRSQLEAAMRSRTAPVKEPRTCPNISLSRRSAGSAPQLTATNGPFLAGRVLVDGPRDDLLAGAALAGDQHGGIAVTQVLDQVEDAQHGRRAGDDAADRRRTIWCANVGSSSAGRIATT